MKFYLWNMSLQQVIYKFQNLIYRIFTRLKQIKTEWE